MGCLMAAVVQADPASKELAICNTVIEHLSVDILFAWIQLAGGNGSLAHGVMHQWWLMPESSICFRTDTVAHHVLVTESDHMQFDNSIRKHGHVERHLWLVVMMNNAECKPVWWCYEGPKIYMPVCLSDGLHCHPLLILRK